MKQLDFTNLTFLCRVISREKPKDGPEQGRSAAWQNDMCPSLPWLITFDSSCYLLFLASKLWKFLLYIYLLAQILVCWFTAWITFIKQWKFSAHKDSGCWSCWIWQRWGDSDKHTYNLYSIVMYCRYVQYHYACIYKYFTYVLSYDWYSIFSHFSMTTLNACPLDNHFRQKGHANLPKLFLQAKAVNRRQI